MQKLTGDYPAAAATLRQALALSRDLGDRLVQAQVLTELAAMQRLTGDYPAAAASNQQALSMFRDLAIAPAKRPTRSTSSAWCSN